LKEPGSHKTLSSKKINFSDNQSNLTDSKYIFKSELTSIVDINRTTSVKSKCNFKSKQSETVKQFFGKIIFILVFH